VLNLPTRPNAQVEFLTAQVAAPSAQVAFLSAQVAFLSAQVAFLSAQVAFLSAQEVLNLSATFLDQPLRTNDLRRKSSKSTSNLST
jgi:hypothetical protein